MKKIYNPKKISTYVFVLLLMIINYNYLFSMQQNRYTMIISHSSEGVLPMIMLRSNVDNTPPRKLIGTQAHYPKGLDTPYPSSDQQEEIIKALFDEQLFFENSEKQKKE